MNLPKLYATREEAFCKRFNIPYPYVPPKRDFHKKPVAGKLAIMSDPHEPYISAEVPAHILAYHHDAEMLVIPGDLGDYYSKSRFARSHPGTFRDEVFAVFKRLEWASTHFRQVKVMLGNHDNRPEKKISSLLQVDVELLIFTETNLLEHLAAYFPNVEVVNHKIVREGVTLTYVWQFGDMIFLHGEISRTQSSATMEWLSIWLHRWQHFLKLKPYSVIFQGHNHQSMKQDIDGETWVQMPTSSDPYSLGMEYIHKRMYKNPPVIGYTIAHHAEGKCDANRTYNVVLRSR